MTTGRSPGDDNLLSRRPSLDRFHTYEYGAWVHGDYQPTNCESALDTTVLWGHEVGGLGASQQI